MGAVYAICGEYEIPNRKGMGFSLLRVGEDRMALWPTDRHPGQAKREPGSQKGRRFKLRSRIRLRLSGMTAAAIVGASSEVCLGFRSLITAWLSSLSRS